MTPIDKITIAMGLGTFYGLKFEWLNALFSNMTLGIHGQEWEATADIGGQNYKLNEVYIGLLFFRFILEFVIPE